MGYRWPVSVQIISLPVVVSSGMSTLSIAGKTAQAGAGLKPGLTHRAERSSSVEALGQPSAPNGSAAACYRRNWFVLLTGSTTGSIRNRYQKDGLDIYPRSASRAKTQCAQAIIGAHDDERVWGAVTAVSAGEGAVDVSYRRSLDIDVGNSSYL